VELVLAPLQPVLPARCLQSIHYSEIIHVSIPVETATSLTKITFNAFNVITPAHHAMDLAITSAKFVLLDFT
jgi:hypothetical protein